MPRFQWAQLAYAKHSRKDQFVKGNESCPKDPETKGDHLLGPLFKVDGETKRSKVDSLWRAEWGSACSLVGMANLIPFGGSFPGLNGSMLVAEGNCPAKYPEGRFRALSGHPPKSWAPQANLMENPETPKPSRPRLLISSDRKSEHSPRPFCRPPRAQSEVNKNDSK